MDLTLLSTGLDSVGLALGVSHDTLTAVGGAVLLCVSVLLRLLVARRAAK